MREMDIYGSVGAIVNVAWKEKDNSLWCGDELFLLSMFVACFPFYEDFLGLFAFTI